MSGRYAGIGRHLREGEELIWTGCPLEGKECGWIDRFLIPFSGLFLALSTLYGTLAVHSIIATGFQAHHALQLVLFLLGGGLSIYSYFLRFWIKKQVKSDLVYGLTNQRRLFIRDDGDRQLFIYEGDDLITAHITEQDRHGVGTIYIFPTGIRNLLDNTGLEFLSAPESTHRALFDIPDCERVLGLILNEDE